MTTTMAEQVPCGGVAVNGICDRCGALPFDTTSAVCDRTYPGWTTMYLGIQPVKMPLLTERMKSRKTITRGEMDEYFRQHGIEVTE